MATEYKNSAGAILRPMEISDYDEIYSLWQSIEGFAIRSVDDSRGGVERFLKKNPVGSVVATCGGKIVGTILCGNDGRTGYFYHVCVEKAQRNKGIGTDMARYCTELLKGEGISKISLIAFRENGLGNSFWQGAGWREREDVNVYDLVLNESNVIDIVKSE